MNYIYVYNNDKELKYKFSSIQSEGYAGVVRSANVYFAFDDTGAELESGSSEFVVESEKKLDLSENDFFDIFQDELLIGRFYVIGITDESAYIRKVQGVDIIGKAEKKSITQTCVESVPLKTYLTELYKTIDEDIVCSPEIDQITLVLAETEKSTLREISQKIALGHGVTFTTKNNPQLVVSVNPLQKLILRSYSTDDIYESMSLQDKDRFLGTISVYARYVSSNAYYDYSHSILGYVPIGKNIIITPYYDPLLNERWKADREYADPYNGFYEHSEDNIMVRKAKISQPILNNNRRIDEYASVSKTFDNFIKYSIDLEALDDVYADSKEGKFVDDQGNEYALIIIQVDAASTKKRKIGAVTTGFLVGGEEKDLILPCAETKTLERIKKSLSRVKQIEYQCLYNGEQLGEIIKLPDVFEVGEYATIRKMSLDFSAHNIFADIVADILPPDEVSLIKYEGAEYGDGSEYGDGTEYGGYDIYKEG